MLYLVLDSNNVPWQKWSVDPEKDFVGFTVLGPAIKDESGNPEDSANLKYDQGRVIVDETKKGEARINKEKLETKARERLKAKIDLKSIDISSMKSIAELKTVLQMIQNILDD